MPRKSSNIYREFLKVMKAGQGGRETGEGGENRWAAPASPRQRRRACGISSFPMRNRTSSGRSASPETTSPFAWPHRHQRPDTNKSFADSSKADAHAAKLIEEKTEKGYEEKA